MNHQDQLHTQGGNSTPPWTVAMPGSTLAPVNPSANHHCTSSNISGLDVTGSNLADSNVTGSKVAGSDVAGSDVAGSNEAGSNLDSSTVEGTSVEGGRREFLARAVTVAAGTWLTQSATLAAVDNPNPVAGIDHLRRFLMPYVVPKASFDLFLDPAAKVWAKFHPTYGYLLRNSFVRDGVDGSHTLARYEATGQRLQVNFRDQVCRINSYGDSFTQGHQVSDGETWQEVLAAHFCEPIRNFGIGGFGVYQAYRRLLATEETPLGVKNLIFNIWGDDHYRSIYAWRWLSFPASALERMRDVMFHANPWVHARLDEKGELVERPNFCPDEKTLRKLSDPDFVFETFHADEVTHALLARRDGVVADPNVLEKMAQPVALKLDWSNPDAIRASAEKLLHTYALRVGIKIMERLQQFVLAKQKKLIVLLSYPMSSVWHTCSGNLPGKSLDHIDWHPRYFKEFLLVKGIPVVDTIIKHLEEFKKFRLSPKEYVDRYYIGHYTPVGNNFFAFAIKDELIGWLDPKPPTYRADDEPLIRFKGYLPG